MDTTITAAAIATLISAITSATVSLLLAQRNSRKFLDDQLDAILKIAIQYPYLESDKFTEDWTSNYDKNDERCLRYEVYCTLVFNFMSRFAEFYKHDVTKIEKHLAMRDWARLHTKYWRDPTKAYENVDTYDQPFVNLIESYLKGRVD